MSVPSLLNRLLLRKQQTVRPTEHSRLSGRVSTVGAFGLTCASASLLVLCFGPVRASAVVPIPEQSGTVRQRLERRIDVIQHNESVIKAFIDSDFVSARLRADELDKSDGSGAMYGMVIAVKDNIHVDGFRTTAGTKQLAALPTKPAASEATVVKRMRDQGAIIIGTTNMDTWARGVRGLSEVRGQTANPLDPSRNAGGSSAGSAAAVAAGMVDAAIGTDTCGSIRYPASSVGVYGLRPTWGYAMLDGVVPLAPGQDAVGPLAKTPQALRQVWETISGIAVVPKPPQPASPAPLQFRLGVLKTGTQIDKAVLARAKAAGFELVDVGPPPSTTGVNLIEVQFPIAQRAYLSWRGGDGPQTWITADGRVGPAANQSQQTAIMQRRAALQAKLVKRMSDFDVDALVQPVTTAVPVKLGQRQPSGNCMLAAGSGLPALAIPGTPTPPTKVSIGVEFIGGPMNEFALLRIAELIR
jgi:amidase